MILFSTVYCAADSHFQVSIVLFPAIHMIENRVSEAKTLVRVEIWREEIKNGIFPSSRILDPHLYDLRQLSPSPPSPVLHDKHHKNQAHPAGYGSVASPFCTPRGGRRARDRPNGGGGSGARSGKCGRTSWVAFVSFLWVAL